jgi:hypothetical protein
MKTLHPRRMYTHPRGGVQGGYPPVGFWGQVGPRRKNCLVNVYCNFIVNMDRSSVEVMLGFFSHPDEINDVSELWPVN